MNTAFVFDEPTYDIKALREQYGLTRPQFARYFDIPYRTVQEWEIHGGCKSYVYELMKYKLEQEENRYGI